MPDIPLPEDLSTYVRGLESRIRALETAPRALNTTQPWLASIADTTFNTASLVDVDASPVGPTITLEMPNAGNVLITASSYIGLNDVNQSAIASIYIDGVQYIDALALSVSSGTTVTMAANIATTRVVALPAGVHVFTMKYRVTSSNANFSSRSLTVQPF